MFTFTLLTVTLALIAPAADALTVACSRLSLIASVAGLFWWLWVVHSLPNPTMLFFQVAINIIVMVGVHRCRHWVQLATT